MCDVLLYGGTNSVARQSRAIIVNINNNINKQIKSCKVMKKKNYDEASVIRSITKKADVSIDYVNKIVQVKKDSNEVGNGTWGKIDYLCHYCGYSYIISKTINSNRKIINREFGDDNDRKTSKKERKQLKLDIVKSTKKMMKK